MTRGQIGVSLTLRAFAVDVVPLLLATLAGALRVGVALGSHGPHTGAAAVDSTGVGLVTLEAGTTGHVALALLIALDTLYTRSSLQHAYIHT